MYLLHGLSNDADLFRLSSLHEKDKIKPRLYMIIGKDDFMYEDNVKHSEHIKLSDYDYEYIETDGFHSRDLWDVTIQNALKWMLK